MALGALKMYHLRVLFKKFFVVSTAPPPFTNRQLHPWSVVRITYLARETTTWHSRCLKMADLETSGKKGETFSGKKMESFKFYGLEVCWTVVSGCNLSGTETDRPKLSRGTIG